MKKAMKISMLLGVVALVILTATAVFAKTLKTRADLPQYVGSQVCLGCHAGKFATWSTSGHAEMLVPVDKNSDLPAPTDGIDPALKAELDKATWIVAGQRFLARDPASGELKYLNVQWDATKGAYVAYKGGSSWTQNCAGCHSTGWDSKAQSFAEPGIGCEMCHGPGKDHVLGKGDVTKITKTSDSAACGQCHNQGGKAADGARWASGYKPAMGALSNAGFTYTKVDGHGTKVASGLRQYAPWQSSKHATAAIDLNNNSHASAACYECHSGEVINRTAHNKTFDPKTEKVTDGVSCNACHDPHNSTEEYQLRMEPQALCTSCHTAELAPGTTLKPGASAHHPQTEMQQGFGAASTKQNVKGAHSDLKCIDCHMTEGNHQFKVIRPEDVAGTTRKDTCTTCHTNRTSDSRATYLELWQNTTTDNLAAAKADFATIDAALKANPTAISADLKAQYDAAKTNVSFVDADASKGVHNFDYTMTLMNDAKATIARVKTALGK